MPAKRIAIRDSPNQLGGTAPMSDQTWRRDDAWGG